jgi:Ca2+-binding EF-hand superfamily protein
MTSKYLPRVGIPKGFPDLLKDFTREVLRVQPANIYEFGAQYFEQLSMQGNNDDSNSNARVDIARMSAEEMELFVMDMFKQADADNSGALSLKELRNCLRTANLGLSNKEIREIMMMADDNGDGCIQYEEFLPLALDILDAMYAKLETTMNATLEEQAATAKAENYLLHGVPAKELEEMLLGVFSRADADGSGKLDRQEFLTAMRAADLGLTRNEINVLMSEVDEDNNGLISYEEFVPLCLGVLTEVIKSNLLDVQRGQNVLSEMLLHVYTEVDTAFTGLLPFSTVRNVLRECDLGLSSLQIHSVMSAALRNESGQVEYKKFCATAGDMISRMFDETAIRTKAEVLANVRSEDRVKGMPASALTTMLLEELKAHSGCMDGRMRSDDVVECLVYSAAKLTPNEISAVLSYIVPGDDGMVDIELLVPAAVEILMVLEVWA